MARCLPLTVPAHHFQKLSKTNQELSLESTTRCTVLHMHCTTLLDRAFLSIIADVSLSMVVLSDSNDCIAEDLQNIDS